MGRKEIASMLKTEDGFFGTVTSAALIQKGEPCRLPMCSTQYAATNPINGEVYSAVGSVSQAYGNKAKLDGEKSSLRIYFNLL